ncbi:MAG: CHRD domain-containing protein [Acidobacteria bacterium]|nr:CHRD domain-containing protein [Acidobacteriota bacterium]
MKHHLIRLIAAAALCASLSSVAIVVREGTMSGAQEVPPNASTATGSALVTLNDVANTLRVQLSFSGLAVNATAGHIHCCAGTGVKGPVAIDFNFSGNTAAFPPATAGSFDFTSDLTNSAVYGGTFRSNNGGTAAGARAAFIVGFLAGNSYTNIHNASFPGGEIRAQMTPEPASVPLSASSIMAVLALRRRRTA